MSRGLRRVAACAAVWTLFLWWAVIGWPDSAETAHATLSAFSAVSIAGLVSRYGWQHRKRFLAALRVTLPLASHRPALRRRAPHRS